MSQVRSSSPGLLYPMMIIAAIAVIAFSIVGIASMTGWMPHAMVGKQTAVPAQTIAPSLAAVDTEAQDATPAFQCAECGVIQSVREFEQLGSLRAMPVAAVDDRSVATTGL